jgi:hypothetical protein
LANSDQLGNLDLGQTSRFTKLFDAETQPTHLTVRVGFEARSPS